MLPTKHGQLHCLTRVVRFINWTLYEEDINEQPIPTISLSTLMEKEYGKILLLDMENDSDHYIFRPFSNETDAEEEWRQERINGCLKDGRIYGEGNMTIFMMDLVAKGILLPGEYVVYV